MRTADVFVHNIHAGEFLELMQGKHYRFTYRENYIGEPVSLTMPVARKVLDYDQFPPFFDGLLPEGIMLDGLLRGHKIDRLDMFSQLIACGADTVGAVTIFEKNS
jgi:serine/threonine-protein kinase HipA